MKEEEKGVSHVLLSCLLLRAVGCPLICLILAS